MAPIAAIRGMRNDLAFDVDDVFGKDELAQAGERKGRKRFIDFDPFDR